MISFNPNSNQHVITVEGSQVSRKTYTLDDFKISDTPVLTFAIGGDKNGNLIVDESDLNEEYAQVFKDKGLIGKTWDFIKEHIGQILNLKSAVIMTEGIDLNGQQKLGYIYTDEAGNSKLTKEITKDKEGNTILTQRDFNTYDEYGNIIATRQTKEIQKGDHAIKREFNVNYRNTYNEDKQLLHRVTVDESNPFILLQDENGKLSQTKNGEN